ncbi:hypothetical protein [Pseudomonas alloputida]|uniref:hypothetical protein n=1 Tax=Pseudomonas TaxID=286 RepID=UPI003EEC4B54
MKTFNFVGSHLSSRQRQMLEQQQRVKAFMSPVLNDQVMQVIQVLDARKEQGAKPEKQWFLVSEEHGTTSIAEWLGY